MRVRLPSASRAQPSADPAAAAAPQHDNTTTPRSTNKRPRVTPPPTATPPPPPPTAAARLALQAEGSDALAELMLAVPAPRIELPNGADDAARSPDDAAAARLCRAILDKARTLKHSGDAALRSSSADGGGGGAGAGVAGGAEAAPPLWDGRALSFYVCAAVTYIECAELVHRLAIAVAAASAAAAAARRPSSPSSPSPQPQPQQQHAVELARLGAQLRPQLMAQTATLCHAAAAGARQRLARLRDDGAGQADAEAPAAAAEQQRAQYELYAALCERLAAVCHMRHVAANAGALRADARLCAATAGGGGGGGGGGGSTPPPLTSVGGGGAASAAAGAAGSTGPLSSAAAPQGRLADAAQHTLRSLDLVAGSSRALRAAAADPRTRACPFSSAAVAHAAHVNLDLGAPGGGGDVFRLAARARAALACIKSMGTGGGGR